MNFVLALLVGMQWSWAGDYFTALRDDQNVPEKCKEVTLQFFDLPPEYFFLGRKGTLAVGFTFEYPVERDNARILWSYFKDLIKGEINPKLSQTIQSDPELRRDYEIILNNYEGQGFDFRNEGDILEVLAIHQLFQEFPENLYYITGGITYHEHASAKPIGEIDVYVGRRDDCSSVAVGEVKLGWTMALEKAKKQLESFEDFLINFGKPPFVGPYQPKSAY